MLKNGVLGRAAGGHIYVKISRHTGHNAITESDLNVSCSGCCEGREQ